LCDLPKYIDRIYGIAGPSVNSSFSPIVHNKGLRELQLSAIYLPFKLHDLNTLRNYISRLREVGLPIQGLTINAPLKGTINTVYDASRAIVEKTQSANVLVMKNGECIVDTTDDLGLIHVLKQHKITVMRKRVAVIGCGCSGRVAAYTLSELGAQVVLYNRSPARGELAEKLLQLPYYPLEQLDPHDFDLLVNTAAFAGNKDLTFSVNRLNPKSVVIDFVYTPYPNSFIAYAKLKGLKIIDGMEVLNGQLLSQFQCLTGHALPYEANRVLEKILKGRKKAIAGPVEAVNEAIVKKAYQASHGSLDLHINQ
jgi:shikimate dehydrogenase